MKNWVIVVLLLILIGGVFALWRGYVRTPSEVNTQHQYDTLNNRYTSLQTKYDSIQRVLRESELLFERIQKTQDSAMIVYRSKLKYYEKAIANIPHLSNSQLLDSITNYYSKRLSGGYSR